MNHPAKYSKHVVPLYTRNISPKEALDMKYFDIFGYVCEHVEEMIPHHPNYHYLADPVLVSILYLKLHS